ncbi:MAG: DUF445 domain-containing protein [Chitinophagaceae bacterium]
MNIWLAWIPIISACTGWLFNRLLVSILFYPSRKVRFLGFSLQGQLPVLQQQIAEKLGTWVTELLPIEDIKMMFSNPANLQKMMPRVEEHIDQFLRVKLPQAMPMIAMFVGDKTISQLKAVFMSELETLFPLIMNEYMNQLDSEIDINRTVTEKFALLHGDKIATAMKALLSKQLRFIELMGVLGGFSIGLVQVLVILILNR